MPRITHLATRIRACRHKIPACGWFFSHASGRAVHARRILEAPPTPRGVRMTKGVSPLARFAGQMYGRHNGPPRAHEIRLLEWRTAPKMPPSCQGDRLEERRVHRGEMYPLLPAVVPPCIPDERGHRRWRHNGPLPRKVGGASIPSELRFPFGIDRESSGGPRSRVTPQPVWLRSPALAFAHGRSLGLGGSVATGGCVAACRFSPPYWCAILKPRIEVSGGGEGPATGFPFVAACHLKAGGAGHGLEPDRGEPPWHGPFRPAGSLGGGSNGPATGLPATSRLPVGAPTGRSRRRSRSGRWACRGPRLGLV
jgi:hypothetical protein